MAYEVYLKEMTAQPVIRIRLTTDKVHLGDMLGELSGELAAHAVAHGGAPAGPLYARYWHYGDDYVDLEAGLPLARPIPGAGRVEAAEAPGGRAAATWHIGPYSRLHHAYTAIEAWLSEQGLTPADAPLEVYAVGHDQIADASQLRTEVVWPLS